MTDKIVKVGIMAPAATIDAGLADRVQACLSGSPEAGRLQLDFHPQCFEKCGHFAGEDALRSAAFVELANNEEYDAVWFARGGYGACRLLQDALPQLGPAAHRKTYLGYSDAGSLLGALYSNSIGRIAHGPMPADIKRTDGDKAVRRAFEFLAGKKSPVLEEHIEPGKKYAAFNMTILSNLLGTPYQPDLTGHVLMLEEVSEHMYRIDRSMFHITSNPGIRKVAGIRLGRCSDILENDVDFELNEEEIAQHWCRISGIPWLGRADIGHDAGNKVVPFG